MSDIWESKIQAPFNEEQVQKLNEYQQNKSFHPYTCGGGYGCCKRDISYAATKDGWICPCGVYTQNWAHTVTQDTSKIKCV